MFLGCALCALRAQDLPSSAATADFSSRRCAIGCTRSDAPAQSLQSLPPAAVTLNDVLDRVVQREHLFMAQMRHMHPMVETYLQDLKNDSDGNPIPVKDQYFLGRLDMSENEAQRTFPSLASPDSAIAWSRKLTGVYSLHFLPMGFAQMVVLDTDFQKKYYNFTFVRREFLGELRCLVIDVQPKEGQKVCALHGHGSGSKIRITTSSALTEPTILSRR